MRKKKIQRKKYGILINQSPPYRKRSENITIYIFTFGYRSNKEEEKNLLLLHIQHNERNEKRVKSVKEMERKVPSEEKKKSLFVMLRKLNTNMYKNMEMWGAGNKIYFC